MSKLSDLTNKAVMDLLGSMNFVKPVLAINAASAATVKTTNALTYTVNGVMYSKAILAAQSIAVTHTDNGRAVGGGYVQPASTTVYYTLSVNAAGVISVTQGTFAGQTVVVGQSGTSYAGDGSIPDVPAGYSAFGVIKVITNAGQTFAPGTDALDNLTKLASAAAYFDICSLPVGLL